MNKQHQPSLASSNDEETDLPSASVDCARAGNTVVFTGDPSQVQIGFAIALRLMGLDASVPDSGKHEPPERGD